MLEKRLLFFLGDLPADEKARANLLANPDFVRQYEQAVIKSLQDPSMDMLEGNDFNPQAFAVDQQAALQTTKKALSKSLRNPEVAAFMVDLNNEADYKRDMGSLPEVLEVHAAEHVDKVMADNGYLIGQIPEKSDWQDAKLQAFAESTEYLRKEQELDLLRHSNHILLEPIAKVIVAQKNNQTVNQVEFPQSMMGGYSDLLRSDDARQWFKDLWGFVERARHTQGGTAQILEFFRASNLSQQQAVIKKYAPV